MLDNLAVLLLLPDEFKRLLDLVDDHTSLADLDDTVISELVD